MGGADERLTERALERRVKRWLLGAPFDCYVQVAPGLEELLARELVDLGVIADRGALRLERGGIGLRLDLEGVMAVNLGSRVASRVLLRLGAFPGASAEMLHDRARKLQWEVHLGFEEVYSLRLSSRRSRLQAGEELSRAVTGAVARHMAELGLSPKPVPDARLEFYVRLERDRCTVSLNTSGDHLHRRGMRTHVGEAPARETLAAAVALLGLELVASPDVVIDPFCGSGSVLIEVADVLSGRAPGRARSFAFEHAGWHRPGRWREVRRRLLATASPSTDLPDEAAVDLERPGDGAVTSPVAVPTAPIHLLGLDADERAVQAARSNLHTSGHFEVRLHLGDSLDFDFDGLGARGGLIVSNLPYGVRLGSAREAEGLSRRFLSRLGAGRTRWHFALLTKEARRVTEHPDVRVAGVLSTSSGGLDVAVVTGAVGGAAI